MSTRSLLVSVGLMLGMLGGAEFSTETGSRDGADGEGVPQNYGYAGAGGGSD